MSAAAPDVDAAGAARRCVRCDAFAVMDGDGNFACGNCGHRGVYHARAADVLIGKPDLLRALLVTGDDREPPGFADRLARALHDADCGCGTYDDVEDPRYIDAVRAALATCPPAADPEESDA